MSSSLLCISTPVLFDKIFNSTSPIHFSRDLLEKKIEVFLVFVSEVLCQSSHLSQGFRHRQQLIADWVPVAFFI